MATFRVCAYMNRFYFTMEYVIQKRWLWFFWKDWYSSIHISRIREAVSELKKYGNTVIENDWL